MDFSCYAVQTYLITSCVNYGAGLSEKSPCILCYLKKGLADHWIPDGVMSFKIKVD